MACLDKPSFLINIQMKSFLTSLFILLTTISFAQQSCPKWGPYVKTKGLAKQNAELMMADVMFPTAGLAPYTYACSVQFGIGKSGGYCGIQKAGDNEKRFTNNIFSIWDFPNKIQITATYKDPLTFVGGFGGEGTGLHSHADFNWKPDQWYTNIIRRWSLNDSTTNVGYWIYDHTAKTYKHYVTFVVPEAKAMLHGDLGSFLENFADDSKKSRTAVYKSYWMLGDQNNWLHPDTLIAEAGVGSWKAEAQEGGVKLTSCGTEIGPSRYSFPVKEKSNQPEIVKAPSIYDLSSYYDHTQKKIFVNWSILNTATPQLSYAVNIYDNKQKSGKLIATLNGTDPDLNMVGIAVSNLQLKSQDYYITLQLTDIFGQTTPIKTTILRELKP